MKASNCSFLIVMILLVPGFLLENVSAAEDRQSKPVPSKKDLELLNSLQRVAFDYFWFETHPVSGLTADRAGNTQGDDYHVASLAATGFGLASLPIAVEHAWITRESARKRAIRTLQFVRDKMWHTNGWLYHFVDWKTGERVWNCEVSSIDTSWFLAGALLAGEYFGGETKALAEALYRRVDFGWMLTDGGARPNERLLGHGWTPESGFLKSRWDNYSEHLLLNLLAIGSPAHPIPPACWEAWERNVGEYQGIETYATGPLFVHQYSQAFIDFRNKRDRLGFEYFESSARATRANRKFCLDQAGKFRTYGLQVWGLSACDKPGGGYEAYGAPPGRPVHDGTVAPWATLASIVFTPDLVLQAVRHMDQQFPRLKGRYGFSNAFNLDQDWFAQDVIGIDLGAALLLIENYRSGLVWKYFMSIPSVQEALNKAGLRHDPSESADRHQ